MEQPPNGVNCGVKRFSSIAPGKRPIHPPVMPAKPFVLAVKAVILDEQRRCLLIRRSAHNRSFVGCWEWPGGKVDPGEEVARAVARETREETGLDIELTGVAGATHFQIPKVNVVLLCMEARVTGGKLRLSDEHDEAAWVPLGDLPGLQLAAEIRDFMLDYAKRKETQHGREVRV